MVESQKIQRRRLMKWRALRSTACHHDHSEEQFQFRPQYLTSPTGFNCPPHTLHSCWWASNFSFRDPETFPQRTFFLWNGGFVLSLNSVSLKVSLTAAAPVSAELSSQLLRLSSSFHILYWNLSIAPHVCFSSFLRSVFLLWEMLQNKHLYKITCKLSTLFNVL